MKYSESYMFSKDIDWFFKMKNQYFHVASAGGRLPATVNDREKLREIQYQVYKLPYLYPARQIRFNGRFIRQLLSEQNNEDPDAYEFYIESFVNFARKGFISCDRTVIADHTDDSYHIVCAPPSFDNDIQLADIPVVDNPDFIFDINQFGIRFLEMIR